MRSTRAEPPVEDPRFGAVMKEWVVLQGSEPPWLDVAREAYRFVKVGR